jgi:precorrin-2 dehydrogenase/sirohydrochlorin ferrochelatase
MGEYYPVFLRLNDRLAIVIGGGEVATRKVQELLEASARVRVIAPEVSPQIAAWASAGKIEANRRQFLAGDLAGAVVVVAATGDPVLNQTVANEARQSGSLVNVVDDPASCDYLAPAVVRRGQMVIAISTGGQSPAVARWTRERIEEVIGLDLAPLAAIAGQLRFELQSGRCHLSAGQWQEVISVVADSLRSGANLSAATISARQKLVEWHIITEDSV